MLWFQSRSVLIWCCGDRMALIRYCVDRMLLTDHAITCFSVIKYSQNWQDVLMEWSTCYDPIDDGRWRLMSPWTIQWSNQPPFFRVNWLYHFRLSNRPPGRKWATKTKRVSTNHERQIKIQENQSINTSINREKQRHRQCHHVTYKFFQHR